MKTETIGGHSLSAWAIAPGTTWVQSRSPQFARKLSRRSDGRLVATGVYGGFLRIFEFYHGLAWAGRLISRYQSVTSEPFQSLNGTPASEKVVAEVSARSEPMPSSEHEFAGSDSVRRKIPGSMAGTPARGCL